MKGLSDSPDQRIVGTSENSPGASSMPKPPTWRTLSARRVAILGDISASKMRLAERNVHRGIMNAVRS